MLLIHIAVLGFLAFVGLKEPVKKKQLREGVVFSVIFICGASLLIAQKLGVKMPYPIDEINKFFKNMHLSFD